MEKKSNTKQALWIGIGNLFSTGIALVSAMILSRYFDRVDYGTYKQVIYIYSTTQIVFTLGLPRCFSYFLPKLPIEQAKQTINKIINIFYVTGLIFSALLFLSAPYLAEGFKNPDLTEAVRIYSPVAFFLLPTLGLEGILATYQKSEYIALYNCLTRIFMLICVVVPVIVFGGTYRMALWGFVVSSFITYLLAVYLRNLPLRGVNHQPTTICYRDIWGFALPLMTASIWGALINSTDQFFISRYFGTEAFANFSNGAAQLPFVGMVMASTVTVLTPVFTREIHNKNYAEVIALWQRSTLKACKLLIPLIVFFIFFAEILMIVMYSDRYTESSVFFQIKQITAFTQVITAGTLILAIGHTSFYSKIHMYALIALFPLEYLICKLCDSAYWVTAGHVFIMVCLSLAAFIDVTKYLGVRLIDFIPVKSFLALLFISILASVLTYVIYLNMPISNNLLLLSVSFVIYLIIYYVFAKLVKIDYSEILLSLLPKRITDKMRIL